MSSSLDELLTAEFKEAFDEFDKVKTFVLVMNGILKTRLVHLFRRVEIDRCT